MRVQQILYLNLVSARIRTWNGSHYVQDDEYSPDEEGVAQFRAYLDEHPDRVTAVFIDIVQEEHYRDTIPHLGRSDQRSLLARKTAKIFSKTPYRTGVAQGRDGKNRDKDRVLISGITRPEALQPWMQCLYDHKTPVAGIFSPAMLSYNLLAKLDAASDATLLVTQRFDGRYRHSFYDGKHLIGSRLLRKPNDSEHESAEVFAQQLDESQQYFNPSFAPATGNKLEAVIICEPETAQELGRAAAATVNFKLRLIDINEAGRKLGVDKQLQNSDSGYLFGQLLRNRRPAQSMAPPRDRRYYTMHRIRSYAKTACIGLIGAAVIGAGLNAIQVFDIESQATTTSAAAMQAEKTLGIHATMLPKLETDPFEMKGAVTAYNRLVANNASPTELFSTVSAAMDYFPHIQVDAIEWSTEQAVVQDMSLLDPTAVEANEPPPVSNAGWSVSMSLAGRVTPFDGDYTQAFAEIDRFIEKLEQQQSVHSVTRTRMPLDVDPRNSLVGEIATTAKRDEAIFSLKLVIRKNREDV